MDTLKEVQEEQRDTVTLEVPNFPSSRRMTAVSLDLDTGRQSLLGSRSPSSIIASFRRPSQTLKSINSTDDIFKDKSNPKFDFNKKLRNDVLATALSALYAKTIVVLGIALPVTEIISDKVSTVKNRFQGFYLYLYFMSIIFIIFTYVTQCRKNKLTAAQSIFFDKFPQASKREVTKQKRYGSFYLRLGAIAFGIGLMVYSGLEFGQYFELKDDPHCQNVLQALTPATRMILTLLQMQFIFLNANIKLDSYTTLVRFGYMHMIATNLCEWLHVIVEETKHEIFHLINEKIESGHNESTPHHGDLFECRRSNIMGSVVQNVAPFLFPCTVEYSLICAVILFEIWKHIKVNKSSSKKYLPILEENRPKKSKRASIAEEKSGRRPSIISVSGGRIYISHYQFSVDCAGAQRGLFSGILIIVMTIISLIVFFVFHKDPTFNKVATFEISFCEMTLYIISMVAIGFAIFQMRDLKYFRKNSEHPAKLCLDTTLLVVAQSGVFIYCMFSIIGSFYTLDVPDGTIAISLVADIFSLIQTVAQTMFIVGSWWRRCRSKAQLRKKPGRQAITLLLVLNVSLWIANTLQKIRAEFRPTHLDFYGIWAWTIITHVSMPLVIFYRFHSTICLFELWKNIYKIKNRQ